MAFPSPRLLGSHSVPVLRWGVLGPGEIADQFVGSVHRHTRQQVIAVASRNAERAGDFANRHQIPFVDSSYHDLVSRSDIDIVYVSTHIQGHLEHARLAVEAGKHVLVEKPLGYSSTEAADLLEAGRARGVLVMEAMWTRYLPQSDVLRQLLEDPSVGAPEHLIATFAVDNRHIERLWQPGTGSIVYDMGIYPIAFAHSVCGPPSSVEATGVVTDRGMDASATVTLRYPDGKDATLVISGQASLPCTASISCEHATLSLEHPFFVPTSLVRATKDLYSQTETWHDAGVVTGHEGLSYQATYAAHYIEQGVLESPLHSHAEIVSNLQVAEQICRQLGVQPWTR